MADGTSPVYEARYGWDLKTTGVVLFAVVLSGLLLLLDFSPVEQVLGLLLLGGRALIMAGSALSRKAAFRVDGTGVLLGGSPFRYRATTAHVPWADITGFVLWRQDLGGATSGATACPMSGP